MSQVERTEEMRRSCRPFLLPAFAAARVAPLIGEPGGGDCAVQLVRVKAARFTLRYRFPSRRVVYAKAYKDRLGRKVFSALRALWEAGFNTGWLRVPEPLGLLEEENIVLMGEARGAPLSGQLAECPLEAAAGRVRAAARWLAALHSTRLCCLEQERPCERSKILQESKVLAEAATARPGRASALLEFLGSVKELAQAAPAEPPLTPAHGRFTPSAVFVDSDVVTGIGLDTLSLSDPARDVATFVARLKYRELFKAGGEPVRAAKLATAFLDEYAGLAGSNLANLPYYLALYCLKEFAKVLAAPGADPAAQDRAERLCRMELDRCLREGAPERSLPKEKRPQSSAADAIAFWSAWSAAPDGSNGAHGREAGEAGATLVQAKHTARLTLRLTTRSGSCVYAKCYPDHLGRRCVKVTTALWASGFGHDSPYRVPEIAAFLPDRTVLLMHPAEGVPLCTVLENGDPAAAVRDARDAARWLAALHRSPVRVGRPERDWISLKAFRVPARLIEVCARFPDRAGPLLEILYELKHRVERLEAVTSVVQTHGSYRPKHVFVAGGVTTAIDLDRSLPADPAKDVAEFVSDLRSSACDQQCGRQVAERAAAAFLEEYFSQAPVPGMEERVACYSACYLALRLLKNIRDAGWPERFEWYRQAIEERH